MPFDLRLIDLVGGNPASLHLTKDRLNGCRHLSLSAAAKGDNHPWPAPAGTGGSAYPDHLDIGFDQCQLPHKAAAQLLDRPEILPGQVDEQTTQPDGGRPADQPAHMLEVRALQVDAWNDHCDAAREWRAGHLSFKQLFVKTSDQLILPPGEVNFPGGQSIFGRGETPGL